MSKALWTWAYLSRLTQTLLYFATATVTGLGARTQDAPLEVSVRFLVPTSSLGPQSAMSLFQNHLLKQNIGLCLLLHLRLSGYRIFCVLWGYSNNELLYFSVITYLQSVSRLILCFTNEQNILISIITTCVRGLQLNHWKSSTFLLPFSLRMSSQNL